MNYDKQLSKYAKHLDNPKYYGKMINILYKAKKSNYTFKKFNNYDLALIKEVTSDFIMENDYLQCEKIIKYLNNDWFIISDKKYILIKTHYFCLALETYLRMYLVLAYYKIKQFFCFDRLITFGNVENDFYLCKGALKAAKFLNTDVYNLDEFEA